MKIESNLNPVIIMSVEKGIPIQDINYYTAQFEKFLKDCKYPYKKIVRMCNCILEPSFLIDITPDKDVYTSIRLFKDAGRTYKQESILVLDERCRATLLYCNRDLTESLGKFKACTRSVALKQACYTYDTENGQYYIIEEA